MTDMAEAMERTPRRFGSRYSRFVDLLKFLLPATAFVLIILLVLWPQLMGGYGSLIVPMLLGDAAIVDDSMVMRQPHYSGLTSAADPYEVVAETAIVDPENPNRIHLTRLEADLERERASDLRLTAASGVYYRAIEKLKLEGDVRLTTSDGYRFETPAAQISLARGRVWGERPVQGNGPAGALEADRFEIRDGGDVLRFEGRVKVTVEPDTQKGAAS